MAQIGLINVRDAVANVVVGCAVVVAALLDNLDEFGRTLVG